MSLALATPMSFDWWLEKVDTDETVIATALDLLKEAKNRGS